MARFNREQPKREAFREFYGRNVDQMPELLADNRIPLPFSGIMKQRIVDGDVVPAWNPNYIDTSDLIAYSTGDKVKFVLTVDAKGNITKTGKYALGLINPQATLKNGAIVLSGDEYDALKGPGVIPVKRKDLGILETWLTPKQVSDQKPWRIFARDLNEVPKEYAITKDEFQAYLASRGEVPKQFQGKDLLNAYAGLVKAKTGCDTNMGVYPDGNDSYAKLRAWFACRVDRYYRSGADGGTDLDSGCGRFVGLAPEVLSAKNLGSLDASVQSALTTGKGFEYNGTLYVPVSDKRIKLPQ